MAPTFNFLTDKLHFWTTIAWFLQRRLYVAEAIGRSTTNLQHSAWRFRWLSSPDPGPGSCGRPRTRPRSRLADRRERTSGCWMSPRAWNHHDVTNCRRWKRRTLSVQRRSVYLQVALEFRSSSYSPKRVIENDPYIFRKLFFKIFYELTCIRLVKN